MKYDLLTNATAAGPGSFVSLNRVATLAFVIEYSSNFVPNGGAGSPNQTIKIEQAEETTDTGGMDQPSVGGMGINGGGADAVANTSQTKYLTTFTQKGYWRSIRATVVNAPNVGSVSVRMYAPDGD